jgi:hypothetical protein
MADYPPAALSEGVKKLPEVLLEQLNIDLFILNILPRLVFNNFKWIQLGCGDKEYCCEEKGATFLAANLPDKLPDLSEHK